MRRIYESDALRRDEGPFSPTERSPEDHGPTAARSIPSTWLSDRLLPQAVHRWAIRLSISTSRRRYAAGKTIPFTVTLRNEMPFPVSIPTRSPLLWRWAVDEHTEAATISTVNPPDRPGRLALDRGERIRIRREWDQRIQVSPHEWEAVDPGSYTLGAWLNVDDVEGSRLADEVEISIE